MIRRALLSLAILAGIASAQSQADQVIMSPTYPDAYAVASELVAPNYYATYSALTATYPNGGYLGQIVWLPNPAVPLGRSRLQWNGTAWVPPYGEIIASIWQTGATPIAQVTPGTTNNTIIYSGVAIPSYMTPIGLMLKIWGGLTAKNASGIAGCNLGVGISTSAYMPMALNASVTPNSDGVGISTSSRYPLAGNANIENIFVVQASAGFYQSPVNNGAYPGNNCGLFSPGVNSLMAFAKPSSITDQITFNGATVISMGNL